MPVNSATSARFSSPNSTFAMISCNSSISSAESEEKLLTKFSGFLISCAMPAVSWPSEASFSVWISRFCAVRSSASERSKVVGARAQIGQQPCVLDGDRGLVAE